MRQVPEFDAGPIGTVPAALLAPHLLPSLNLLIPHSAGPPIHQPLPGLPNPSFPIPAAERPYYHALCVMAGNFSTILWLKLFDELEVRFGIPASAAHPYLAQMAANLLIDAGRSL